MRLSLPLSIYLINEAILPISTDRFEYRAILFQRERERERERERDSVFLIDQRKEKRESTREVRNEIDRDGLMEFMSTWLRGKGAYYVATR